MPEQHDQTEWTLQPGSGNRRGHHTVAGVSASNSSVPWRQTNYVYRALRSSKIVVRPSLGQYGLKSGATGASPAERKMWVALKLSDRPVWRSMLDLG